VVVSGEPAAVEEACERAKARGARRAVRLEVSGAFHSPLMAPAAEGLARALAEVSIADARFPVVANVSARPLRRAGEIRAALEAQLLGAVRWEESMRWLVGQGVERFVEVGTGTVLTGLLRSLDRDARCTHVEDPESLSATLAALGVAAPAAAGAGE
jgi:[acyl-carrier-protein] S-malonyltransferase